MDNLLAEVIGLGADEFRRARVVFIDGAIGPTMSGVRQQLMTLALDSKDPIWLYITSGGGVVGGALAVMDTLEVLRSQGIHLVGVVMGEASSAALVLLQSCDERIAGPHAILMAHGSSGGVRADRKTQREFDRYVMLLHTKFAEVMARRSTLSEAEWLDLFEEDTPHFYSADEALALGLIDRVLSSPAEAR